MNIGVFVCGCNGNISKRIETAKVAKEAEGLEDVSFGADRPQLCSLAIR